MIALNETHNPELISWVNSANSEQTDFPIQNLPFAVFRISNSSESFRCGVAIGDQIIDLKAAGKTGLFEGKALTAIEACAEEKLNAYMALGQEYWSSLRLRLSQLFRADSSAEYEKVLSECLISQDTVEYDVPCQIGDYTDFYTSVNHATTVGSLFRPDNPLLPNYKWIPIGYHGRASSIVISGTDFNRPCGQLKKPNSKVPEVLPCNRLDYELELAVYIGTGNDLGSTIDIDDAENHVFGISLLNDWSARDVQAWEYQPLGPFLSKNFISSVSPWIVTMEALVPFRTQWSRDEEDPQPLDYLDSDQLRESGSLDIKLDVYLHTDSAKKGSLPAEQLTSTSFKHSYWTLSQMVSHHTVNGCNLNTGDMLGTGTQSGPEQDEAGSMLELSLGGSRPLYLSGGESRTCLEDGDEVVFKGWCNKEGARRIGFGDVTGTVRPART